MKKVIRLQKNNAEQIPKKTKVTDSLLQTLTEIDTELEDYFNKHKEENTNKSKLPKNESVQTSLKIIWRRRRNIAWNFFGLYR